MGRKKGKFGKFKNPTRKEYYEMMWNTGYFEPIMGCGFNYALMSPEPALLKVSKKDQTLINHISRCDK